MPLHFAYGPAMDRALMGRLCPGARALGISRLPRHRFALAADGRPTIVRDSRRTVLGVLWDVPLSDMPALDRAEGLAAGRSAKIGQPVILDGSARRALLYVARAGEGGRPKPGQVEAVLQAARAWDLPADYLHEIEHGEPAPRRPGAPLFRAPI